MNTRLADHLERMTDKKLLKRFSRRGSEFGDIKVSI